MRILSRYLISFSDLIKLASYSDDERIKEGIKVYLAKVKKGILTVFALGFVNHFLLFLVALDVNYHRLDSRGIFTVLITFIVVELIISVVENALVYHPGAYVNQGILYNWLAQISEYLNEDERKNIVEFSSNFSSYYLDLVNFVVQTYMVVVIVSSLLLSPVNIITRILITLTVLIVMSVMVESGSWWKKTVRKVIESNRELKELTPGLMRARIVYPTVYNSITSFGPLIFVILVWFKFNSITAQVGLFITIVSFYFDFVGKITKIQYSKDALTNLNKSMSHIFSRYVINQDGFKKLTEMCSPAPEILEESNITGALILRNYIPMSVTNASVVTHEYNFEFTPGIYQLNGINGVGKTTFLESLTLPDKVRVEYSRGSLAFQGKPFFDPSENLVDHRNKYIYIGTNAPQLNTENLCRDIVMFDDFPNTKKFIVNFCADKKEKQSEGEKAVISICSAYQKVLTDGIKLVFIDEALSRIYNDETTPLRSEIIELVKKISEHDKLIVIIVDHMTKVHFARQLHISKKSIELI